MKRPHSQRGFALVTVLVLLIVLALTAFFSAALTRSNIQVVNNIQNEKEALTVAEAGIAEALYRLSISGGNVTVNGNTFNAAIKPDVLQTGWTAKVQLNATGNTTTGASPNQVFTTPSIQPAALRLPYSKNGGEPGILTIGWNLAGGAIRTDPDGREIVQIVSTATSPGSGRETRTVTVYAVKDGGQITGGGPPAVVALGDACADGISVSGGASSVQAEGAIHSNAGPSVSACPTSIDGRGNVQSQTSITSVGNVENSVTASPTPTEGALRLDDPLSNLPVPCYPGGPVSCVGSNPQPRCGSAASPTQCTAGATQDPGIYYGGLRINGTTTLNPGVYIIAGGNVSFATGSTTSAGAGVMIFLTNIPSNVAAPWASLDWGNGNLALTLTAPSSGPFQGVAIYQDRLAPSNVMPMQGGNSSPIDINGAIYAAHADLDFTGGANWDIAGSLIVESVTVGGNTNLDLTTPGVQPPFNAPEGLAYSPLAWQDS